MRELRRLTAPLLAVSVVVGLAALVRMADPAGPDDLTGVIRLPALVRGTIATLFGLAVLIFIVDLTRRLRARRSGEDEAWARITEPAPGRPWLRAGAQLLSFANFVVLAYLLAQSGIPQALMGFGHGGAGADGMPLPAVLPDAPFAVTWTFATLALIAGCIALALTLWVAFSDRLIPWWERASEDEDAEPPLARAVDESLEDLRAEPDARRAIIRCYARFERAAAASGLAREPWQTPMEFMREALARLPAPRASVRVLTRLFELARFSDRPLGAGERDQALDALDAIRNGERDAVAS